MKPRHETPPAPRGRPRAAAWLWSLLAAAAQPAVHAAQAPAAPEETFSQPWYYTEVVVFQRPAVLDYLSDEALTRAPAPLPRNLRLFDPPPGTGRLPSADYALYPITHAYLAFPYLDHARLGRPRDEAAWTDEPPAATGAPAPAIFPRLAADPLLDYLDALAEFEDGLVRNSYRWLPSDTFTLTATANRLSRTGGYQVLLHGRWLQPVPPRDAPQPLWFQAGSAAGDGQSLQGTFAVTVGRYLHFATRLYYAEPLIGRIPVDRPQPPPGVAAVQEAAFDRDWLTPAGTMQLRESRRLRSDELHYLDHPKLGVLVRVEPVQPTPALSAAFAALQGTLEEGEQ